MALKAATPAPHADGQPGGVARINEAACWEALRRAILRGAPRPGAFSTGLSGVEFHRHDESERPVPHFLGPVAILVVQGEKHVRMGGREYRYGRGACFFTAVTMPVSSCAVVGERDAPYLSLSVALDDNAVARIASRLGAPRCQGVAPGVGAASQTVGPDLLDAFARLAELAESESWPLGEIVLEEVRCRLLASPFGRALCAMHEMRAQAGSIGRALEWLARNYRQPVRIEDLASLCGMGLSTFHKHFKLVTTVSPLWYQKRLRLAEARRLMLEGALNVSETAFAVGYGSVTQFVREYRRLYGAPPGREAAGFREERK